MPTIKDRKARTKLPRTFSALVRQMPPRAIGDEVDYGNTREMIDRLMASGRLSPGQSLYLETLVQLVQAYEAAHHAIDTSAVGGLTALEHLLSENNMTAADLARMLGVHPSMGSKLLNGDRSLTIDHVKKLATRFRVSPALFIDGENGMSRPSCA